MWSYLCVYSEKKKKNRKKGEPNFSSILAQNTDINTNPLFVRLIIAGTNILHICLFFVTVMHLIFATRMQIDI